MELLEKEKKIKVGIINFWCANNRGAILTNYALNEMVKELGYDVYTVNYVLPSGRKNYINRMPHNFAKKFLSMTRWIDKRCDLPILNNEIDCFIVGSDQVFRYCLAHIFQDIFYMDWVNGDKKLIACSASFGVDKFTAPYNELLNIKRLLHRFDSLSVRELDGIDILRDTFGLASTQIIDPVFCIDIEKYENIIQHSKCQVKEDFIVDYFVWQTEEHNKIVEYVRQKLNVAKVIHLHEITDVEDFLWYLKNAKFIVTDSFHGTCFSLIFNKKFIAIPTDREYPSRFITLEKLLNISDKILYNNNDIYDYQDLFESPDYDSINKTLVSEKERALKWLQEALAKPKQVSTSEEAILYECLLTRDRKIAKLEYELSLVQRKLNDLNNNRKKVSLIWLFKYYFYRIASNFVFGNIRKKLLEKKEKYKKLIKSF